MALYEKISAYYDELFPLKESRVAFITSFLNKENQSILDVGCATGELSLCLAMKGHHIVGIDLDFDTLEIARGKRVKGPGLALFLVKDMTHIGQEFLPGSFGAVLCFGNTLVHLENPAAITDFFIGVANGLKKDGTFMVQVVNYDRILAGKVKELPVIERENLLFQRDYSYDAEAHRIQFRGRLTIKETETVPGSTETVAGSTETVLESTESLYPLTYAELKTALDHAGFSDLEFFGNEEKAPYDIDSPALIAVARKR